MITFAQLQADPSNMELANAYASQQGNILNSQGGTGPSQGSSNLTQGQQYLAGNADVFNNAVSRANDEGLFGGDAFSTRLDEIAREHFNSFGVADGRAGFGYTPPATGTFAPSPNETPSFSPPPGGNAGNPSTDNTLQSGLPGYAQPTNEQSQQSTFDNSNYQTALNNFGGLLNNYGDFFGGLLSGAQNGQDAQPMNQGQNFTGFYGPQQAATGFGGGFNNFGNLASSLSGGFSNGSTWGGGGGSSSGGNTGHRQLWTT